MPKFVFSQLIRQMRAVWAKPSRRRPNAGSMPLESLEQRCLPATVIVTPVTELVTTESGGTAQFTVQLSEQPKKNVKIPIQSSDTTEGKIETKLLIFSKTNWNQPQTVTVTGVDDTVTDGNQNYSIMLGLVKGDKLYKKQDPTDVAITNQDNDAPGIQVVAGSTLQTTEGGGTATFTVRLNSKPTGTVTIPFHSSNPLEGTVTSSITFNATNWNQPKTVTITGVNDSAIDGDQTYQVIFDPAQSSDSNYAGLTANAITVVNRDNDEAGLQISPTTSLTVLEGGSKELSIKLKAKPSADVTVTLVESTGASQATLSTTTLVFTPDNWNTSQRVTVSGTLGDGVDGNQAYGLTLNVSSDDPAYSALAPTIVNLTIADTDDQPHNLDGNYTGSYTGSVRVFGIPTSQNGNVAFSVVGNMVTVTQPADASGTISGGSGTFAPTSGPLVGGSFTGTFVENQDGTVTVTGTWTYSNNGNTGSGTWTATRPAQ